MNKKQRQEWGKQGAEKRYAKRYETLLELSKHVHKDDLTLLQSWPSEYLDRLLAAYMKTKN